MKITTLMLGELASNCYIQEVGNKKCVIVDIGGDAPIVFRRLEMMQLEPVAILLTHGHYDHIAGVEQVREKYQIPVYVHSLDANMLTDSRANQGDWLSTQPFQPVQEWKTVEDGDTLQFGDNTFTVIHTPGHTPGSVCLQSGDVLYTGDTLFRWRAIFGYCRGIMKNRHFLLKRNTIQRCEDYNSCQMLKPI